MHGRVRGHGTAEGPPVAHGQPFLHISSVSPGCPGPCVLLQRGVGAAPASSVLLGQSWQNLCSQTCAAVGCCRMGVWLLVSC